MKSFVVFVCLLLICLGSCEVSRMEVNLIVRAIREVTMAYFSKKSQKMDLVIFGNRHGIAESIASQLLPRLPENISVYVSNEFFRNQTHLQSSTLLG